MDGVERRKALWKNLKQRLGFKGMGFCGSTWGLRVSDITVREEEEEEEEEEQEAQAHEDYQEDGEPLMMARVGQIPAAEAENIPAPLCVGQIAGTMNLATALAAERRSRNLGPMTGTQVTPAPLKSLMRLFEETDGVDAKKWKSDKEGGTTDSACCVCMERNKGAAFIPCGHTYCRVCSRELWFNRGFCPLCNRSIIDILDIF